MKLIPTEIPAVIHLMPTVYSDDRGFFMETYQQRTFAAARLPTRFVQDNHSGSRQGVLRGLHYQILQPQGKLIQVVAGSVFDVAVDLRRGSPTFGGWVGRILSAENRHLLWIPPGFAHGFYTLSDWAEVTYKATDFYAPAHERTIRWDDAELSIAWPILESTVPIVSPKDQAGSSFSAAEVYTDLPLTIAGEQL